MSEWDLGALILEKWGLPGFIALGLAWAMYRFGPMRSAQSVVAIEGQSDIDRLREEMSAQHAQAQRHRDEVMQALHKIDTGLAVMQALSKRGEK